jgi:hypothetical protein
MFVWARAVLFSLRNSYPSCLWIEIRRRQNYNSCQWIHQACPINLSILCVGLDGSRVQSALDKTRKTFSRCHSISGDLPVKFLIAIRPLAQIPIPWLFLISTAPYSLSIVTTWDFRGKKWRAQLGCKSWKTKNIMLMELEQRYVIQCLDLNDLKLDRSAMELSNTYSRDSDAPPSIN